MRLEGQPLNGDLTKIVTESQNISASGVYCTSPHYLAPLSKVALTIILPSLARRATATTGARRLLKCDGIVVRCMPSDDGPRHHAYELACSFIGLDARHRDVIEEYVSWRNLEAMGRAADIRPVRRPTARATARKPAARTARKTTRTSRASTARRKTVRARGSSGR